MRRDVEAAVVEVEADAADQLLAQPALRLDGERAFERQRIGLALLAFEHAAQQVGQEAAQLVEQNVDARGASARLELVEQRVVERGAQRRGLGLTDAAHDVQHFGERRQQRLEVGVLLGRAPGQLAGRTGARARLDEVGRQGALMHPGTAHLAQVGGLPGIERGPALLRACEKIGHLGRGDDLVGDDAQGRELVGAILAGAVRHHGRTIPVQDRRGAADGAQPREAALQLGIGIVGDHVDLPAPVDLQPPVLPVIGEIDADQRQREQEPGDGVLEMVVGDLEPRLAAHGHAARIGRGIGVEEERVELGIRRRARHLAHQRHVGLEPDVLVGHVLGREAGPDLGAAHDAGQLDPARRLRRGLRRGVAVRHPAAIEQDDRGRRRS